MNGPDLVLPGESDTPVGRLYANPVYALYHYLVQQGQRPTSERNPALLQAAEKAVRARRPTGLHGVWDHWEQQVASARSTDQVERGLVAAMTNTASDIASALRASEHTFLHQLWPERLEIIQDAVATIRDTLQPSFAKMLRRQGTELGLTWPDYIDAYLVTDCYDRHGGYSHPLTIDVSTHTGLTLCETLIHEATHVADVHTAELGKASMRNRLTAALTEAKAAPAAAWNIWHAIIFAASGGQIRKLIDPTYVDYALEHDLYRFFGVPELPSLWEARCAGTLGDSDFFAALM